jgi:hypothetical protein
LLNNNIPLINLPSLLDRRRKQSKYKKECLWIQLWIGLFLTLSFIFKFKEKEKKEKNNNFWHTKNVFLIQKQLKIKLVFFFRKKKLNSTLKNRFIYANKHLVYRTNLKIYWPIKNFLLKRELQIGMVRVSSSRCLYMDTL